MFSRRPTIIRFNHAYRAARAEGRDLGDIPAKAHDYATECGCMAGGLAGTAVLFAAVPALILSGDRLLVAALVIPVFLAATGLAKGGAIAVAHWRLAGLCRRVEEALVRSRPPSLASPHATTGKVAS